MGSIALFHGKTEKTTKYGIKALIARFIVFKKISNPIDQISISKSHSFQYEVNRL